MIIANRVLKAFLGSLFAVLLVLPAPVAGEKPVPDRSDVSGSLPQDTGTAGLKQMLVRLRTTARMMHTIAHPDDEDGGMLTLESRGKGVSILQLTLNRGEGGQNKTGSNLFDELGLLRTLELLEADKYYGIEQRFSRVVDFGFSKTPDETFQKWGGHDVALGDMVRLIRTFHSDVLVSRFQGTSRDGHGNHQAAAILTKEAFRAAADPSRFPEQIKEGLLPWQVKKLYTDHVFEGEPYDLKLNTGQADAALGTSYVEFALKGLNHQLSQGAGNWKVDAGDRFDYYKLVDSVLPRTAAADGHEQDFFDGINTTLPGLAERLGAEQSTLPQLRPALLKIEEKIKQAAHDADKDPQKAAGPLLEALQVLNGMIFQAEKSDLSPAAKFDLLTRLQEKQQQCETAANLAMNVSFKATVTHPTGASNEPASSRNAHTTVSPGGSVLVVARFHNGSKELLQIEEVGLDAPEGWITGSYKGRDTLLHPGEDYYANYRLKIPENAEYTRPYFQRSSPEQAVYDITNQRDLTLPFPPPPVHAHASYSIVPRRGGLNFSIFNSAPHDVGGAKGGPGSRISTAVTAPYVDDKNVEHRPTLAITPRFSVLVESGTLVVPAGANASGHVLVDIRSNVSGPAKGTLRLEVPEGWRADPAEMPVEFAQRGQERKLDFTLWPATSGEIRKDVSAVFESDGHEYREGYTVVTREDLDTFYYYQQALQHVSVVDVKRPEGLKIGYIMGAGDDIPTVLRQLGMDVTLISPQELASSDLNHYGTIVTGIRAYDTRDDVRANNRRLLDFVSNGGTLIVQYNTGTNDFNSGKYTPFSAHESRDRVSVEEAPVDILAPQDSVFRYPNQIAARDFNGWVQERGLYFMDQWDSKFQPLLSSHDPGESAMRGGLLRAEYGKGTYIYNGYAFFRQLPAGVPGAVRLYVNLLSAGHER